MEIVLRSDTKEVKKGSASEPESGSSGGGGAQAQLGVAAESRPVSEDRRGRGGGSSWVAFSQVFFPVSLEPEK